MEENKTLRTLLLHAIDLETKDDSGFVEDLENVDDMTVAELCDYILGYESMETQKMLSGYTLLQN